MGHVKDRTSEHIVDTLQHLIKTTKAANLKFATQLLQLAQMDILMSKHGIAAEEIDQLRMVLERRSTSGDILDLEELRQARASRVLLR